MSAKQSIYIFMPYPYGKSPSQRFRFEQYLSILEEHSIKYVRRPFYSNKTWEILHWEGNTIQKVLRILGSFGLRWLQLFQCLTYDYVFIHREIAPIGPPIFEFILTKIFRKKVIYDFDDAIWLPNYSEANTKFHRLKYYSKVNNIMKWASKISAGNAYLAEYASQFNSKVVVNPTTIDTTNYHNPELYSHPIPKKVVIGWTGTHTTAKYLDFLVPILSKLAQEFDFEFCVISNEEPEIQLAQLHFVKWTKETEIEDLLRFSIGVMPLSDDQWSKGKCGFKALQYMALGVPAIASPVGVNSQIIDHGINGYLCETEAEWYQALHQLLSQPELVQSMHDAARKKIVEHYSVISNTNNFINLFSN